MSRLRFEPPTGLVGGRFDEGREGQCQAAFATRLTREHRAAPAGFKPARPERGEPDVRSPLRTTPNQRREATSWVSREQPEWVVGNERQILAIAPTTRGPEIPRFVSDHRSGLWRGFASWNSGRGSPTLNFYGPGRTGAGNNDAYKTTERGHKLYLVPGSRQIPTFFWVFESFLWSLQPPGPWRLCVCVVPPPVASTFSLGVRAARRIVADRPRGATPRPLER